MATATAPQLLHAPVVPPGHQGPLHPPPDAFHRVQMGAVPRQVGHRKPPRPPRPFLPSISRDRWKNALSMNTFRAWFRAWPNLRPLGPGTPAPPPTAPAPPKGQSTVAPPPVPAPPVPPRSPAPRNLFHASGHAPREDLLEVVRRLRPRRLLPVHTERPHLWKHRLQGEGVKVLL